MFRNYLKTAWRSILKNKFFTFINLLCLSLGITFSLLIGMYVFSQYNVNSHLQNLNKQYILKSKWAKSDMGMSLTTLDALAKALKEEYPDLIQNYYRYNPVTNVVSAGETHLKSDIAIGDTTFVSMYGLSLLQGNPQNIFPNNNAAVITEDMAIKLYGTTNALNKRLSIQTLNEGLSQEYVVSGVLKKIPSNSVFNIIDENGYGVYVPTIGNQYYRGMVDPITSWNNASSIGFVELKDNATVANLDAAIKQLLKKYTPVDLQKNLTIETVPLKDYYLKDNNGAIQKMIWTLSIIAVFILLMAVFNFININIGTSTTRLKEVGIRKVFGSSKWQLVCYSLSESIMLTLISGIFSFFLYELLRSIFGQMLSVALPSFWLFNAGQVCFYLVLILIIGIASGLYPAFWISNIDTVASVKGQFASVNSGSLLRRILLVVQFGLGIFAFICASSIYKQVSYIFSKDMGYQKDQLMVISAFPKKWNEAGRQKMETIKQGLLELPNVESATLTFDLPIGSPRNSSLVFTSPEDANRKVIVPSFAADKDYASTFHMTMRSGSFLRKGMDGYVPGTIVLNESAIKELRFTNDNAIGKVIKSADGSQFTISGVMKDYNFDNVRERIGPIAIVNVNDVNAYRFLVVKVKANDNFYTSIKTIEKKWKSIVPEAPFDYSFVDQQFADMYRTDIQLKKAFSVASVLNLLIIFLGLSGIVSYSLTRRKKEIAVRRVLGANVLQVLYLFLKEYSLLLLIGNIIAWPLAYLFVHNWLQGFSYKINNSIIDYVLVGIAVCFLTCLLIVLESYRSLKANPVNDLRNE